MKSLGQILSLTDIELIEGFCAEQELEGAYDEFVKRYYKDCQKTCEKICNLRKLDKHIGLQISHDTFEKIRRYKSFKRPLNSLLDERKAINGFLYRIAVNLFNDYHKTTQKRPDPKPTFFSDLLDSIPDLEDLQAKAEFAAQIFNRLNKKEQRVLIVDLDYKKHHIYLPDDVIESLSIELNVKPDTIRKIRERVKLKVKKFIDEYNEQ